MLVVDQRSRGCFDTGITQERCQRRHGCLRDLLSRVTDQPVLPEPNLELAGAKGPDQRDPKMLGQRRSHVALVCFLHRSMFAPPAAYFGDPRFEPNIPAGCGVSCACLRHQRKTHPR